MEYILAGYFTFLFVHEDNAVTFNIQNLTTYKYMDRCNAEVRIKLLSHISRKSSRRLVFRLTVLKFSQTSVEVAEENLKGFICEEFSVW